jgi:hypothetical protein
LGRPGSIFVTPTQPPLGVPAEFHGDSSVAGRPHLRRIDCRVCAFPLLQVAKQGDRLIGNQDLPCFGAKG